MKTVTKLVAATVLAIAAAAPAFAYEAQPVRHQNAMSHVQSSDATRAMASATVTQPTFDPAADASQY